MSKIQFYTNPMSRGQIARWALHEAGADYDAHIMGFENDIKSDDYLRVNPMGKLPAIVDDGVVVTECAAICAYLAEAFPNAGLLPKSKAESASYFRWLLFAAGPVESATTAKALGWEVQKGQSRMVGFGSYDDVVDTLDQWLSAHDYVCGDRFTMADVYVGAQVGWGMQTGGLPHRDSFAAYAERVSSRPAAKEAREIDTALIAQMQTAPA